MPGRTRTKAAKPAEPEEQEPEENGEAPALREVGALHELMAEWLNDVYGDELDKPLTARQVQVVIAKRNEFRRSEDYDQFRTEQDEAREKAAAKKDAEPAEESGTKPARRRRGGKAAEAETEAEAEEETPAPARTARSRRRPAAAETGETTAAAPKRTRRARGAAQDAEPAEEAETSEKAAPARRSRRRAAKPEGGETEPF